MNPIMKRVLLAPLGAAFFLPSNSVLAQPASTAHVTQQPGGIEIRDGNSVIEVKVLENRTASVHVVVDGKGTPRTLVIAPKPEFRPPTKIARSEEKGVASLATPELTVRIQETAPYSISFLDASGHSLLRSEDPIGEARAAGVVMQRSDNGSLYGIHGTDWRTPAGTITRDSGGKVAARSQGDSGAPYAFTTSYGLLIDSDGGEFTTSDGKITFAHSSRPDIEYFVTTGTPIATMAAFSRIAGTPPLPPKWTLGFLNSQWGSTQDEVEGIVAQYREKQLPIDAFILDFDWKAWGEDNYGEWRWNSTSGPGAVAPDKFPDGASGAFAKRLNAQGVKLVGILKPRILLTNAGDAKQPTEAAAYATAHNFWYPDEKPMRDYFSGRDALDLDFNKPEVRTWFWEHLRPAFHTGMIAWWNDEADEYRVLPPNFQRPRNANGSGSPNGAPGARVPPAVEGANAAGGQGNAGAPPVPMNLPPVSYFNNFQFLNMGRALYDGQRGDSNLRVWSINRNFYAGASRYGYALWSGDIRSGFESMALQRERMVAALDTGAFHWSMDTGGFAGHPKNENYARWMEFAAFVPIMRVHGGRNEKRQPWVYGPVAEAAAREALELRYSLLPYIYSYERLTTEGTANLVRPLFWQFPADSQAASQVSEWMFGDALLVSPVVTEGATSQSVYLPSGEWFEYSTGRRYAGSQTIELPVDSQTWKDIPLFVRGGSILATQPVEQYTDQKPVPEITLDVFPSDSAASFTVYDDDGQTYNYEKGQYLRQQVTAERSGDAVRVNIAGATGTYASALKSYLVRVHSTGKQVSLNGKNLASGQDATLNKGWASGTDKFGPVVLVRVTAAAKTPMVISVK